jgi:hypothetical protein
MRRSWTGFAHVAPPTCHRWYRIMTSPLQRDLLHKILCFVLVWLLFDRLAAALGSLSGEAGLLICAPGRETDSAMLFLRMSWAMQCLQKEV